MLPSWWLCIVTLDDFWSFYFIKWSKTSTCTMYMYKFISVHKLIKNKTKLQELESRLIEYCKISSTNSSVMIDWAILEHSLHSKSTICALLGSRFQPAQMTKHYPYANHRPPDRFGLSWSTTKDCASHWTPSLFCLISSRARWPSLSNSDALVDLWQMLLDAGCMLLEWDGVLLNLINVTQPWIFRPGI